MLRSKGKTLMVEEPSHVKQLSLNHACKTGFMVFSFLCDRAEREFTWDRRDIVPVPEGDHRWQGSFTLDSLAPASR
jgi:hypothetical protein